MDSTVVVLTGIAVTGVYTYRNVFKLFPVPDSAPRAPVLLAHHACCIKFQYEPATDTRILPNGTELPIGLLNAERATIKLKEILLLLSALTNDRFFTYAGEQSWFVPINFDSTDDTPRIPQWGQQAYWVPNLDLQNFSLSIQSWPSITMIESETYYNRYGRRLDAVFDMPAQMDDSLDKYFALSPEAQKTFLSSASLLSQAIDLWNSHPSLSFASAVSAIETLISYDNRNMSVETCNECGQAQHRVTERFRSFLAGFTSQSSEFRRYADLIYKYRSAILHRGELFLGEIEPTRFGTFDGIADAQMRRNIITTARICLVNWLSHSEP